MTYTVQQAQADGYLDFRQFENGRNAAIVEFAYTFAIIADLHAFGYEERWCYHTYEAAKISLLMWSGEGEPDGWHRHPATGRRRPNGDKTKEYINP